MQLGLKSILKNNFGYTLVGMAIALAVAGLIMGATLSYYKVYKRNSDIEEMINNADMVRKGGIDYLVQNGHYPCLASLNIATDNTSYGLSNDCSAITAAPGNFDALGMWVEQGSGGKTVVRGAVPFRNLNLPEYLSIDIYDTRLEYAVTVELTDPATYSDTGGDITITDSLGNSLQPPGVSLQFLILSHGRDKQGAYLREGTLQRPCGTVELDKENCDTEAGATDATYISSIMADLGVGDIDHFDDHVGFYPAQEYPLWRATDATGKHIYFDTSLASTLGIGQVKNQRPDDSVALDVNGNIRASGDIRANYLCDIGKVKNYGSSEESVYCLKTTDLVDGFSCAAGSYVSSIEGGGSNGLKVTCSSTVNFTCPTGQVVLGVNTDGSLACGYAPKAATTYNKETACPAFDVKGCADLQSGNIELISIGPAANGETVTAATGTGLVDSLGTALLNPGDYTATYRCQNREWVFESATGSCDAQAADPADSYCKFGYISLYQPWAFYNGAGGGGSRDAWEGIWYSAEQNICNDTFFTARSVTTGDNNIQLIDTIYDYTAGDDITCKGGAVEEFIEACPAGQIGEVYKEKTWVCDSATAGHWSAPTTISNTCAGVVPSTIPLICQEGLVPDVAYPNTTACVCDATYDISGYINYTTELPAEVYATSNDTIGSASGILVVNLAVAPTADPVIGKPVIIAKDGVGNEHNALYAVVKDYDSATLEMTIDITMPQSGGSLAGPWNIYHNPLPKTFRVRQVPCEGGTTGQLTTIAEYRDFSCTEGAWTLWRAFADSLQAGRCYTPYRWDLGGDPEMTLYDASNDPITIPAAGTALTGINVDTDNFGLYYFADMPVLFVSQGKRSHMMRGNVTQYDQATRKLSVYITDVNGEGDSRSDWNIYAPVVHFRDKGSVNEVGDVCSVQNAREACYVPAGAGKYYQYKDCVCQ